jgi:hypothetical protein
MKVSPQKVSKEIIRILPTLWSELASFCVLSAIVIDPVQISFDAIIARLD